MKKVKNILFKLDLEGRGIVNMDSNDQKYVLNKTHLKAYHENVSFAKKTFTSNNGELDYKLKISSDCIRHDMFKHDIISQVPNVVHHDALLYSFIATPVSIIRGYMFANKNETIKRSGALTICDAIQTCNAKSTLEVFSRSGQKFSKDGTSDESDTSFYQKENVGEIRYSTIGNIDLMKLQFVSCDSMFDRYSFNPDYYSLYKDFLKKRMPEFNAELNYYQLKGSIIDIPEYGILMSEKDVLFLVKETLKRLLTTNIQRKGAYAKVCSVKIKLVEDPITDTYNNDNGWLTISTEADIDALSFVPEFFYQLIDENTAREFRKEFDDKIEEKKQKIAEIKKADKKKKSKIDEESDEQ